MDEPITITVAAGPEPILVTVAEPDAAPLALTLPAAPALEITLPAPEPAIQITIAEGAPGADGAPGPAGEDGAPGPAGADGPPGANAEIVVFQNIPGGLTALQQYLALSAEEQMSGKWFVCAKPS